MGRPYLGFHLKNDNCRSYPDLFARYSKFIFCIEATLLLWNTCVMHLIIGRKWHIFARRKSLKHLWNDERTMETMMCHWIYWLCDWKILVLPLLWRFGYSVFHKRSQHLSMSYEIEKKTLKLESLWNWCKQWLWISLMNERYQGSPIVKNYNKLNDFANSLGRRTHSYIRV